MAEQSLAYAAKGSILRFFERAKDVSAPDVVDAKLIKTYGIKSDPYHVISALRFLGLIDEDGQPTDKYPKIQASGAQFAENLEHIVREAYSDLFAKVPVETTATREDVENYVRLHGTPSLASKVATLFIALCQEAGIELSPELASSVRRGAVRRKPAKKREPTVEAKPMEVPIVKVEELTASAAKARLLAALLTKLEQSTEFPPPDVLDHINRLIRDIEKEEQTEQGAFPEEEIPF